LTSTESLCLRDSTVAAQEQATVLLATGKVGDIQITGGGDNPLCGHGDQIPAGLCGPHKQVFVICGDCEIFYGPFENEQRRACAGADPFPVHNWDEFSLDDNQSLCIKDAQKSARLVYTQ
jgi:hypothetical protein